MKLAKSLPSLSSLSTYKQIIAIERHEWQVSVEEGMVSPARKFRAEFTKQVRSELSLEGGKNEIFI